MTNTVNTRQAEMDKAIKDNERLILRIEQNSQVAVAELQANMDRMLEKLMAEIKSNKKSNHSDDRSGDGSDGAGRTGENETNDARADYRPTRYGRIDFPKFNGDDVEGWLYKCDHFFSMDRTPEHLKLRTAVVNLEGPALSWHQGYMRVHDTTEDELPWKDYVRSITARFADSALFDPMEELKLLSQTGTLKAYCLAFDVLLNKVTISEKHAVSLFVGGLKQEIRCMVKMFNPRNLREAYAYAQQQEVANATLFGSILGRKSVIPYGETSRSGNMGATVGRISGPINATRLPLLPTPPASSKITKRLTSKEVEEKRSKGECFWCSEKFTPAHKCKNRQLYIIELADEDEPSVEVHIDAESEEPQISIHALTGIPSYSTMQITGTMGTRTLHILVDSGSTHNFIDEKLVKKLNCPMTSVKAMKVTVANGNQLSCAQMCKDFSWMMQGVWFKADVLAIPLENYDMVLGIQWLSPLGDINWNFANMTMQFHVNNISYVLKGIESNKVSLCSMEKLTAWLHKSDGVVQSQLFGLQLVSQEDETPHGSKVGQVVPNEALDKLLDTYADVFAVPTTLPPARSCDHTIVLKEGTSPISLKPYRYQAIQKDVIESMTQELLDSGVIRNSQSAFAAPVVLVKKKDSSWRMCVDYRRLNEATVKNKFPIPLIDELLEELGGATVFSKLDLRSGYHQIRMLPADVHKTAFRTHQGLFEFLVMPFGLTNAPATFQSLMNTTFKALLRKGVLVFFDDILIYSKSMSQHLSDLQQVLDIMRHHKLFAKRTKCVFGGQSVEYLGHVITSLGVSTDPNKIDAIVQWPTPVNVKQLRGFLGLTGYYRRFIRSFGVIAKPLTELLKKDAFSWSPAAQLSFDQLKVALTTAPVLALPDLSQPFIVETDACTRGIGAVLMQNKHPLAFISKALSPRQQTLSVYEKELLAIILATKQWHYYLISGHFIIRTDQKSLKHLIDQKVTTPLQHSWLVKLMAYDFEIHYKKGCENVAADALSRLQGATSFACTLLTSQSVFFSKIQQSWQDDINVAHLVSQLQQGESKPHYTWDGVLLKRKSKLVVGNNSQLRHEIIQECHQSAMGGHSGIHATHQRLKSMFYWKGQSKDVRQFVRHCHVCQQVKTETVAYPGLLQPLPIPLYVFADISLDFITGLPKSRGKEVIFVVVDRLTKYAHFMALSHPFSAATVAQAFIDNVYKLHGWPSTIVSDRDTIFLSAFWQEFTRLQGISVNMSTAYHPQSDGQTEVVNRCVEQYLRAMTLGRPTSWERWLSLAEFWYNTNFHSATQTTPFMALYGYAPPLHVPYVPRDSSVAAIDEDMCARESIIKLLKTALNNARNKMKQLADLHRSDRSFAAGDWVYLRLHPYVQSSIRVAPYSKLSQKYYGPYLVLEKIGNVAYRLDLPPSAQIHGVFHVSLLKKAIGPALNPTVVPTLPRFQCQPFKILDSRIIRRRNRAVGQILVQWRDLPLEDASWEFRDEFQLRFPDFQLS